MSYCYVEEFKCHFQSHLHVAMLRGGSFGSMKLSMLNGLVNSTKRCMKRLGCASGQR